MSDEPWAPQHIAARLRKQANDLGMQLPALVRASGLSEKAVRDLDDLHSPGTDKLIALARGFRFRGGVNELLGLEPPPSRDNCDPRVLHQAVEIVAGIMSRDNAPLHDRAHIVASLAAMAYDELRGILEVDPNALSNTAALRVISSMLRSELARLEAAKE